MSGAHPSTVLWRAHKNVGPYPAGVVPVPDQIRGTSFFPGGTGLWMPGARELPALPVGGVMVLGHDFHNEAGYEWSKKHEAENLNSPTWRNLRSFLDAVDIPKEHCFFTNVYMGLRRGEETTGRFPGAKYPEFVTRCREFFLLQVSTQRPALILAMGKYVPLFLGPLSSQLSPWTAKSSFKQRDAAGHSIIDNVTFVGASISPCVIVSIVHPCFRLQNVWRRRWKDDTGEGAERAMVKEAMRMAGLS